MKRVIELHDEVMVSDPCYELGTWCQKIVKNVKSGLYNVFVLNSDVWGGRIGALCVIHEEQARRNCSLQWEEEGGTIAVDSGQCGIFSLDTYRKDNLFKIYPKFQFEADRDGDKWYAHMCDKTLSSEQFGVYGYGAVSSSGIGDGVYDLYTLTDDDGKVVGFLIDYLIEEELEMDFWKSEI